MHIVYTVLIVRCKCKIRTTKYTTLTEQKHILALLMMCISVACYATHPFQVGKTLLKPELELMMFCSNGSVLPQLVQDFETPLPEER